MDYLDRRTDGELSDFGWEMYQEQEFRREEAAERAARAEAWAEPDGGAVAEQIDQDDDRPGWDPDRLIA